MLPLRGEDPAARTKEMAHKKGSPSKAIHVVKYFGFTVGSSYAFLYLINKNAEEPVSQKRLCGYALGIPSLIGLGVYLGVIAGFKPCTSLIT